MNPMSPSPASGAARSLLLALLCLVLPACGTAASGTEHSAQEYQALQGQVDALKAEVARLQAQLDQSQRDAATSQQEHARMQSEVDRLKEQLAETQELLELQDHDGALRRLQEATAQLKSVQELLARTDGTLSLKAELTLGGAPLALDRPYTLASGARISFTELRYWLTSVQLEKADGTRVLVPGSYYLMDFMKAQPLNGTSTEVTLEAAHRDTVQAREVPAGQYTALTFNLGVDPTYNDNLSRQTGELSVLKNMSAVTWMWFTSYIFTKTQGTYVKADGTSAPFAWETGTNADLRTVRFAFPSPVTVNSQRKLDITLNADAARLFTTYSPNTTSTINASTETERERLSNDFASMFSLVSVENANR
ncbi:MbnP family protein [Melittangium boletus]|uniref:MbnP family protein n=1 Tax=Melittangium boletus TaxID=83453 RepID=UPI003DA6AC84